MVLKVPKRINKKVRIIATKISENPEIEYITVIPEPYSIINECFPNVEKKITNDGGKLIYGWQIWEDQYFIEAEFHGIWESPEGNLIDISPKKNNEKRILFIQDKNRVYEGFQVKNIRINTSGNILVDDFFNIFDAIYLITTSGNNKFKTGKIVLKNEDAQLYSYLENMKDVISMMFIQPNSDISMECFCGSEKPYYLCHREELQKKLTYITKKYS